MKFIKDEEFIRGNCPMTKEDIRINSISKLDLEKDFNLLDIGSGTGSISIQCDWCRIILECNQAFESRIQFIQNFCTILPA